MQISRDHQHQRIEEKIHDRLKIAADVESQIAHQKFWKYQIFPAQRAQGTAVRCGRGACARRGDEIAAGTRLDNHGLTPLALELVGERPYENIQGAADADAGNDFNRL